MDTHPKLADPRRKIGETIWAGLRGVWRQPLPFIALGLVLALYLGNLLVQRSFKPYTNCSYLIVRQLKVDAFFCNGYTVEAFGTTFFTLPGLKAVMDKPLEQVRVIMAWSLLVFLALTSLCLTVVLNNYKALLRLICFDKEEWKKFLSGVRLWLFLFVGFCLVFYVLHQRLAR